MTPLVAHEIQAELARGRAKFPGNRFMLPALVEEVGELCDALLAGDRNAVRVEAIQVATVAIRIAEEGDATTYRPGRFGALVSAVGACARALLQRSRHTFFMAVSEHALAILRHGDSTFDDISKEESKP